MFFNKQKKLAFVLPPKCGTHTLRNFFQHSWWHYLPPGHGTLDKFIAKYPNLANYTVYGFLRDPLLRFESSLRHIYRVRQPKGALDGVQFESYEHMISLFPALLTHHEMLLKPQSDWLADPRVTVLDFRNIETELQRISERPNVPVRRLNSSDGEWKSVITPAVEEFVRQQYADDYVLASKVGLEF